MDKNSSITEEELIFSLIRKSLILLRLNQNVEVYEKFNHSHFGILQFKLEVDKINNENFNKEDLVLTFSVVKDSKSSCRERLSVGKRDDIISVLEEYNSNVGSIVEDLPNYYRMLFDY